MQKHKKSACFYFIQTAQHLTTASLFLLYTKLPNMPLIWALRVAGQYLLKFLYHDAHAVYHDAHAVYHDIVDVLVT